MRRWFNTAGSCQVDIHYMLSPTQRLPDLERLIDQRSYFVVYVQSQTGKATGMIALAQQFNIKVKFLTLRDFNPEEVAVLYR
jgi:hypothetical protein